MSIHLLRETSLPWKTSLFLILNVVYDTEVLLKFYGIHTLRFGINNDDVAVSFHQPLYVSELIIR